MDEMKKCLSDLRYNTDELSRFLAEMIALEPGRSDRASDCRFWHELMLDPKTGDWVRTYAMEIRDRIAEEHEDAMKFLQGKFRKEEEEEIKRLQAEAEHKAGEDEVFVPEGPFIMGSYEFKDERPVRLGQGAGNFYMDKYPVTNREFLEFLENCFQGIARPVDEGGHEIIYFDLSRIRHENGAFRVQKGYEQHPVVSVTWYGARDFCKWKSQIEKLKVFLPFEEMWEKATRGCLGRRYPWGQGFDSSYCNTPDSGIGRTTSVRKYPKGRSPYGCYDMAGNVWEWTDSWYDDKETKVLRGGSWDGDRVHARCAFRFRSYPEYRFDNIGFRCARTRIPHGARALLFKDRRGERHAGPGRTPESASIADQNKKPPCPGW